MTSPETGRWPRMGLNSTHIADNRPTFSPPSAPFQPPGTATPCRGGESAASYLNFWFLGSSVKQPVVQFSRRRRQFRVRQLSRGRRLPRTLKCTAGIPPRSVVPDAVYVPADQRRRARNLPALLDGPIIEDGRSCTRRHAPLRAGECKG